MAKWTFEDLVATTLIVGGLLGIGYGLSKKKQMNDLCAKFDVAIDNLAETVEVDAAQDVLDAAVEKAVQKKADLLTKHITTEIVTDLEHEIARDVRVSIKDVYPDLSEAVQAKAKELVNGLDDSSLRREIRNDAKNMAAKKFESELDDVLEDYKSNLEIVKHIYESIASAVADKTVVTPTANRSISFSI